MRALQPRERRLVAVGLLVGAVALVWLGVISPVLGGFAARADRRAELLAQYQAHLRLLGALPMLRAASLADRRTAALYQIAAPSEAAAADALRQRVAARLAEAGGVVSAVQPASTDTPSGWVGVRAEAEINLTQLEAALRQLENEPPYVVVEYLSVGADRAAATGHGAPWRFASRFRPSTILPRRGSGEWTPALVILALLAALAAQLALPARTELPDDDGVAPRRPRPFAPAMIPAYPAILRAPIFAPDRAPGEARGPVSAAVAPPLQVLGVAGYGQAAGAVLRTADGAVQALKPGESLDGWRLVAVTPDAAVFAGPAGTARLVVGAKPDGSTTSAPKTAPSSEPPP